MESTPHRLATLLTSLLLGALLSVTSGPGEASAQAVWCTGAGCLISTSTTTTSTAATAALVYLTVHATSKSTAQLAAYLDANRVAVREALVLEDQAVREDLAALILGEHDPELATSVGRALRTERAALIPLLAGDAPIDLDRARLFEQTVHLALADPEMTR